MNNSNRMWWILFSFLAVAAFFLMYVRINEGLSFTNLNNIVGWGLWVTFYIYFLGISVGLFLIYGIVKIFNIHQFINVGIVALYSAFVTLIIGLFFIFIDIGHLGKFWTVFINRNISSILSWELHLYVLYFGVLSLLLVLEDWSFVESYITSNKVKSWFNQKKEKLIIILTYIGIPLAIAVHGGTGALFAAIIFLIGCFNKLNLSEKHHKKMSLLFFGVIVIDFLIVVLQLFIHYYSDAAENIAFINLLLLDDYSTSFWFGQIGIGVVVTLLLIFVYWLSSSKNFKILWLSSLTCLIGIWFIRMNFIAPTLSVPLIEGLSENIYRSAETFKYEPSFMEWLYSYFIIISGVVVYIFGINRIPLIKNAIYHETKVGDYNEEKTNKFI